LGQDKALKKIAGWRKTGLGGKAVWITGLSGTGKTTIARLLAAEFAPSWDTQEIDAQDLSLELLRQLERDFTYSRPFGKGRCIIVNEAHSLAGHLVSRMLTLMEQTPDWMLWIFTTTIEGDELFDDKFDATPFLSRCLRLPLSRRDLTAAFATKLKEFAQREGFDGKPIEAYVELFRQNRNNFRDCWQAVENGDMV
jgi:DNA polymerase III gamma/tau subunit